MENDGDNGQGDDQSRLDKSSGMTSAENGTKTVEHEPCKVGRNDIKSYASVASCNLTG